MFCLIGKITHQLVTVSMDFIGSNKFQISSNSGSLESEESDDSWLITGAAWITG